MTSVPTTVKTTIRIGAIMLHFGIYAVVALGVLALILVGSADVPGPFEPAVWSWLQAISAVTILLSAPTAVFLSTRKSMAFAALAATPILLTTFFIGIAQIEKLSSANDMVDRVSVTDTAIAGHTVPAGSHLRRIDRGRHAITLAPGTTYDAIPIVGEFVVDENGEPIGSARIGRDVTLGHIACSATATVALGKGGAIGCTLAAESRIDDVPCAAGSVANFKGLEGRRADCTTSRPIKEFGLDWPAGTRVDLNPSGIDNDGDVMDLASFTIGETAPARIRLFGKPLPIGTTLTLEADHSVVVELRHRGFCQVAVTGATCVEHPAYTPLSTRDLSVDGKRFAE